MRFAGNRRLLIAVAVVLVVLLGGAAAFLFLGDDDGSIDPTAGPGEDGSGGVDFAADDEHSLVYASGTVVLKRDLDNGEDETIEDLETPSIFAPPGSGWLAYTQGVANNAGVAVPHINLYNTESGEKGEVGVGFGPAWAPSGTALAYIYPLDENTCSAVLCSSDSEIRVVDPESPDEPAVLSEAGKYTLLGWSGENLLAADRDDEDHTLSISPDGTTAELDVGPSQVVSASPDGAWLVTTDGKSIQLLPMEDGAVAGEPTEVGKDDLSNLEWSADSSSIAAIRTRASVEDTAAEQRALAKELAKILDMSPDEVLELLTGPLKNLTDAYRALRESDPKAAKEAAALVGEYRTTQQNDPGNTEVVVFSPDDPELVTVPESFPATGKILWTPEGDSVIFSKVTDPSQAQKQTMICGVEEAGECTAVFSWTQDINLLRTQ